MGYVLEEFAACGLRCWVDQGTLLGLVRDETLIPWDRDIDLSCWDADAPAGHEVWNRLRRRGFLEMRSEAEDLTKLVWPGEIERVRIIDITRYRREGDQAVRRWPKLLSGRWGRWGNALLHNTRLTARHVWSYRRGSTAGRLYDGARFPNRPATQRLRGWIGSLAMQVVPSVALERLVRYAHLHFINERIITASTPAAFFDDLTRIEVDGRGYAVPNPVEPYLEFKYGSDWRTPKREWSFADEDGAVVHEPA
jgi:hypothetical protein